MSEKLSGDGDGMVLQALHAIRNAVEGVKDEVAGVKAEVTSLKAEVAGVNKRLDETNKRLDETAKDLGGRIDTLREFTVQHLVRLNDKVDQTNVRLDKLDVRLERLEDSHHQLNERFDRFLVGEGAQLVKRVAKVEAEIEVIKERLH
jgi:predicted  nucleic acid-binding Zn-ribbon protein